MKIAVGCDHRGYEAKSEIVAFLQSLGHQVQDSGCHSSVTVDYPDIAFPLAQSVASQECDLGILLDGNGTGMCMVANKIHGIRAAVVHDEFTAHIAREQHHCNIICLAVDLISRFQRRIIVEDFLTSTLAEGRHARRIEKLCEIEKNLSQGIAGAKTKKRAQRSYIANSGEGDPDV